MVHFILFSSTVLAFVKKRRKTFLFLSFLILFIFAALRYDYGNDYASYQHSYEKIKTTDSKVFGLQAAFIFLNRISPNFYVLIAVTSFFLVWGTYHLIKDNLKPELYGFAVLILLINPYLFLMNLSAIRQSIAMVLFIIAIKYARNKKVIPYVLIIMIATLFHTSAILLLPFYFVANEDKINKFFFIVIGVILAVLFFSENLFENALQAALNLLDIKTNYSYWLNGSQNTVRATVLSSVYFIYMVVNINRMSGKALMFSKLYIISTIMAVFAFRLSALTRPQMYFDIFSVVALPSVFSYCRENCKGKTDRLFNVYIFPALILIIYVLRYYSFFTNELWQPFWSYHSIWDIL